MNTNHLDLNEQIKVLRAIENLKSDTNFSTLHDFLKNEHARATHSLVRSGESFRLLQGQCRLFEDFFSLVENASQLIEELQKQ